MKLFNYLGNLNTRRLILWCYFLWYLVMLVCYFDPTPRLWLTSLGLSGIIGIALWLSSTSEVSGKSTLGFWPTARLFLMPFCVSSFSALVKGKGFILIFSPRLSEDLLAVGACVALCVSVAILKRLRPPHSDAR